MKVKKMKNEEEVKKEEEKKKKGKKKSPKKKKAQEPVNFPDSFMIIAADLSLRRPGFCILKVKDKTVTQVETGFVDNKTSVKTHGEILNEIYRAMPTAPDYRDPVFYVREHAFNSRGAQSEIGIFKVVGIMDLALWRFNKQQWYELYPITVKKTVTGSAKSTKEQVADSLKQYIGDRKYTTDDESDAAAVAVAFLLQNGFVFPKESDAHEQNPEQE